MLRKQVMIVFLILILTLVMTSCSVTQPGATQQDDPNDPMQNMVVNQSLNVAIDPSMESKNPKVKKILGINLQLLRNDRRSLEGIMDPNIVWRYEGVEGSVPFAGSFTGKAEVARFWKSYLTSVNLKKLQLRYYLQEGNIIHLHWTEEGVVKSTGKTYIMETVQRWEFNERGKLVKFRCYNDTFAMYEAFQPNTKPEWSLAQHPEDYLVNGDGPIDALPIVQKVYNDFWSGNIQGIIGVFAEDGVSLFAGPTEITPPSVIGFGPQGIINFLTVLLATEQFQYLKTHSFLTDGCRVDVEMEELFTVYQTGKTVNFFGLHSFVINSRGQVAKLRSYNDTYRVTVGHNFSLPN